MHQNPCAFQIYSAACYAKNGTNPPEYETVCEFVKALFPEPIPNLQTKTAYLTPRIKQASLIIP